MLRLPAPNRLTRQILQVSAWWVLLSGVSAVGASAAHPTGSSRMLGVEVAMRIGVGLPLGNVDGVPGDRLDQTISPAVPLWLDLGWRFAQHWFAGGYAAFAPGGLGSALTFGCSACTVHDTRLGAEVQYHLLPDLSLDPWIGGGIGYEWLGIDGPTSGVGTSGWEFLNLQGGLDYRLSTLIHVGPFAAFSLGQFDTASSSSPSVSGSSNAFRNKAPHQWLFLGLRLVFDV